MVQLPTVRNALTGLVVVGVLGPAASGEEGVAAAAAVGQEEGIDRVVGEDIGLVALVVLEDLRDNLQVDHRLVGIHEGSLVAAVFADLEGASVAVEALH